RRSAGEGMSVSWDDRIPVADTYVGESNDDDCQNEDGQEEQYAADDRHNETVFGIFQHLFCGDNRAADALSLVGGLRCFHILLKRQLLVQTRCLVDVVLRVLIRPI